MIRAIAIFLLLPVVVQLGCRSADKSSNAKNAKEEVTPFAKAEARRTAFFDAVQRANIQQVESFIAEGFDVNTGNEAGVTPLMVAAGMNIDVVKLLIVRGARVNAKTSGGYTALMSASLNGQKDIAKLLIDSGADVSAKDTSNRTAMKYAQEKNNKEMVDLLKQAGAKE